MNGLYLVKPTSITSTGTGNSSSIDTNGSVTFSTCETLSLNGVFSASYDNYMVVMRSKHSNSSVVVYGRLRLNGTDDSTTSSYSTQSLYATSTTVASSRVADSFGYAGSTSSTIESGDVMYFYGPYLAQPTAFRVVGAYGYLLATVQDFAWTHNQSTAYDGLTLYPLSGSFSGRIAVYGMVK